VDGRHIRPRATRIHSVNTIPEVRQPLHAHPLEKTVILAALQQCMPRLALGQYKPFMTSVK